MALGKFESSVFKALKAMPRFIRKPVVKIGAALRKSALNNLKTPVNFTLYVTSRCNAKCKHCFYINQLNSAKPELTLDQIEDIAMSLKERVKTLMISGGEPFIRDDIPEICGIFMEINGTQRVSIDTNGILTDKIVRAVTQILEDNPAQKLHVQISFDGPEEVHEKIRGVPGCYKKSMKTLEELEKLSNANPDFELSIMTTVCDMNFDTAESFCESFAKEHPTVLHKFNIMRGASIGTYGLNDDSKSELDPNMQLTKSTEELDALFKRIMAKISKNDDAVWQNMQKLKWEYMVSMLKDKRRMVDCTARYTFGVIYENGDVAICEPMKVIGNLKETDYDFYKLWTSEKAKKMKEESQRCFCIHPCNLLDSMSYDDKTLLRLCD
ncbi:MAG: radical SAM protein [Candidatus Woesearchaeota archaeon]